MQRLSYGFAQFYEEISPKGTVTMAHEFDLYTLYMFHSKVMVAFAKMLMHCEKFSTLDNKDKFLLFKNSWKLVVQLERHYSSAKYFGNSFDDLRLLHDNETAHDLSQFDQLRSHFYTHKATSEKYYQLWIPHKHKMQELLMKPIKSLQLTEYEMVYLIAQTLWNVQYLENLSENARLVAEEVSEQINHEMHNYYVHEMGMVNYANRLVKLTKLIENNKIVLDSKRDVFVIARIFELFDCDITESELYDWKK
uniref:NR LBD domain-containing protein n=1 Tax=Acrobeloides nanus TaxID=290746 RepID=A0A914D8N1_9BILA